MASSNQYSSLINRHVAMSLGHLQALLHASYQPPKGQHGGTGVANPNAGLVGPSGLGSQPRPGVVPALGAPSVFPTPNVAKPYVPSPAAAGTNGTGFAGPINYHVPGDTMQSPPSSPADLVRIQQMMQAQQAQIAARGAAPPTGVRKPY